MIKQVVICDACQEEVPISSLVHSQVTLNIHYFENEVSKSKDVVVGDLCPLCFCDMLINIDELTGKERDNEDE